MLKSIIFLLLIIQGGYQIDNALPEFFQQKTQYQARPRTGWPEEQKPDLQSQPDVGAESDRYSPYTLSNRSLKEIKGKMDAAYKEYEYYSRKNDQAGTANAYNVYIKHKQALDEKIRRCHEIPDEFGCH